MKEVVRFVRLYVRLRNDYSWICTVLPEPVVSSGGSDPDPNNQILVQAVVGEMYVVFGSPLAI